MNLKGAAVRLYADYVARALVPKARIRQDDVLVGSFPKSGRTWVRFFVANYLSDLLGLEIEVGWSNFVVLTPGPLCSRESGLIDCPLTSPRVIFSHDRSSSRFYRGRKVVYVTRNFLDIVVSYYYFHKSRGKKHLSTMGLDEFVANRFNIKEAVDRLNHFSSRLERASDLLILRYEDLKRNPEAGFNRLVTFLPYEFSHKSFEVALENSTFEAMRRKEAEERGFSKEEDFHTRKGKSGSYREALSERVVKDLIKYLDRHLLGCLRNYYIPATTPVSGE